MANYVASARSNYFRVKDRKAFQQALEPFEIEVHGRTGDEQGSDHVCLLCMDSDGGGWPSHRYDEATDDYVDVDLGALVAEHLRDEEVAVFMEAGAEKLRYIVGHAFAVNSEGARIDVSIADIYEQAASLGSNVTTAEY